MRQIIPTAEPFFFQGHGNQADIGCLVTHGFTGAPKEMRWLGEYLNQQGYTVCGIRLAGHATKPSDMVRSRYREWLLSVEDGFDLLSACTSQVFLLGLSMGGILSLTSASFLPVRGVVAISTPYEMPVKSPVPFWMVKIISQVKPYMKKSATPDTGWFDKASFARHVSYPENPVRSGVELKYLIDEMHTALPLVKVPVLLIHSRNDDYVLHGSMQNIHDHLGSQDKEMMWVENSGHVITEEPQREKVFKATGEFIRRVSKLP